jgi:hypothetical protein
MASNGRLFANANLKLCGTNRLHVVTEGNGSGIPASGTRI